MSGDGRDTGIGFGRCGYGDAGFDNWRSAVIEADISITKFKHITYGEAGLKGDEPNRRRGFISLENVLGTGPSAGPAR